MARAERTDLLQTMRFHVDVLPALLVQRNRLQPEDDASGRSQAGFTSCTVPEGSVDSVTYREGTFVYTRKQPGLPSMSDISMAKGVARREKEFYKWMEVVMEGRGEYRENISIKHYHRAEVLRRPFPVPQQTATVQPFTAADLGDFTFDQINLRGGFPTTQPSVSSTGWKPNDGQIAAVREYKVYQAFPIRYKVGGDMDAETSEVSIQEIDFTYESFVVHDNE